MRLEAFASDSRFLDHLMPIWQSLPAESRGIFRVSSSALRSRQGERLMLGAPVPGRFAGPVLLASWGDVRYVKGRQFIMLEHGAGQAYSGVGDPPSDTTPDYQHSCDLSLMLTPNEVVGWRNQLHHPHAETVVVGSPRVEQLQRLRTESAASRMRVPSASQALSSAVVAPSVTTAFAWHWDSPICPESRTAFPHWKGALAELAKDPPWRLLGHGHPRAWSQLGRWYRAHGIQTGSDLDVIRQASCLVVDNSSIAYEVAACGIPVVLLDAPWYRRDVHHGMRFWQHSDMALRCGSGDVAELREAIAVTLSEDPCASRRVEVAAEVYERVEGSTDRAVAAIVAHLAQR